MSRLARIVVVLAAAGALSNVASASASAAPVPAATAHKIAALFGSSAYLPSWVPPGCIFISWKSGPPAGPNGSTPYGKFTITFAHAGTVLLWSMYDPNDAVDCKYPYGTQHRTIGGRRIYFINGNHGDSAYFCVGPKGEQTEFTTWDAHSFSAAVDMKIAASARLAR